jgi:hypothetical protein
MVEGQTFVRKNCEHFRGVEMSHGTSDTSSPGQRRTLYLPILLLVLHALMLIGGAWRNSPTIDEVAYLTAGVSHWQLGTFDLCRVSPPLVRLVAALPVIACQPATNWNRYPTQEPSPTYRTDFEVAIDFVKANENRIFSYFFLARCACIPFSLLGAWFCFRWARDLFGREAGNIALALWCFSPNMIAHGQLVTPDCGGVTTGLLAAYYFWRWLKVPGWRHSIVAGLAFGLAEVTRSTWVILFALWPLLWVVWNWMRLYHSNWPARLRSAAELSVVLSLGLYILNGVYLFQGTLRPLGEYEFISTALAGFNTFDTQISGNRFRGGLLTRLPIPFPEDYVQGIDTQKGDFDKKIDSYLRGQWRRGGWWYYYAYALLIKVPLGTWGLILMGLGFACASRDYRSGWRNELMLLVPGATIFLLVSSQTGFSHHMRYVLGLFPFALIWISRIGRSFALGHRIRTIVAMGALMWSICSSVTVYPHSLSYFNEAVGGPLHGDWHLIDSNIDWGQDLFYLKRWLNQHPEADPIRVAYFPTIIDPKLAGIRYEWPPMDPRSHHLFALRSDEVGPRPGWYAISMVELHAAANQYAYFLEFEPVARAGYSILIYHITADASDRVRRKLGLAPERRDENVQ